MSLCDFENESVIILFPGTSWITFAVTGSPSMGEERHLHNNHRVVDFPSLFDLVRLSNTWALSQENDIFWFLGGTFNSLALVQTYKSDVILQDTSPANGRRNQSCEVLCSVGEAWKIPRAAGLALGGSGKIFFSASCRCRRPSRARRTAFLACQGS